MRLSSSLTSGDAASPVSLDGVSGPFFGDLEKNRAITPLDSSPDGGDDINPSLKKESLVFVITFVIFPIGFGNRLGIQPTESIRTAFRFRDTRNVDHAC